MFDLLLDTLRFIRVSLRPRCALAAENLFLRKQLALYLERKVKPRRAKAATKLTLVLLSRLFAWREALTVVKPDTLIRWHRKGFRLFWRWKSKARGRPRIPADLQKLIADMAASNVTWGEERIAAELLLKLGHSGLTSDDQTLYATSSPRTTTWALVAALDDVCPQPRPSHAGLRFLRRGDRQVPGAVRLRDHGSGMPPNHAFQCHRPSHGRMDAAAVPGCDLRRGTVSLSDPRPRPHLLAGVGLSPESDGPEDFEDAVPSAPSECLL